MKTYLIEQKGGMVVDLMKADDAFEVLRKVIRNPRYEGARAADVRIKQVPR